MPGVARGVQWEDLSRDCRGTGEGKPARVRSPEGGALPKSLHGGESWPKSRRRPRLVTPPIPGAGTKPDCGQAGRNQARDLVPEQQVPVQLPERLQGCSGKARPGTADPPLPQLRPLRTHSATRRSSAPAPSQAAPSSPSLGAAATASHSQPTSALKAGLGGGPFPSGRGGSSPSAGRALR